MTPRQLRVVAVFCAIAAFCLLLRNFAVDRESWTSRNGAPVRSGGSVVQPAFEFVPEDPIFDRPEKIAEGPAPQENVEQALETPVSPVPAETSITEPDTPQEASPNPNNPGTEDAEPDEAPQPPLRPEESPTPRPDTKVSFAVPDDFDWSRFAYVQYVTDPAYLCNSLLIFESLARLGSKPARLMLYPTHMLPSPDAPSAENLDGKLLIKAREEYNVTLKPIMIQHKDGEDETWADSFTKLLAFNQTQYDRVLTLDSDGTILQPPDDLFFMPHGPLALPRAYWLLSADPPEHTLASHVMLIEPSMYEFDRIHEQIHLAGEREYDMEIMNKLYENSAMVLPHRDYAMLTAEFRNENHRDYLGSDEAWDPVAARDAAKYVHFSDWPVPKPWVRVDDEVQALREEYQPTCVSVDGREDCAARKIWNELYDDFAKRKEVCRTFEDVLRRSC
ncbi:nucleotide-diphospho-sugar transferase [Emericellopsis atlantica]|uniref:Nucleotide-diphospho-sugar transferase n=1 Tax=Emericellopsis atlantica TaxID=2614577 RepID=A0A9P8CUR1_9HYPO|nr:nucleotide-diphospho-sugar transferase [Emericellopsis atlantica]KAG9257776.1 nucleotide-diphospho-sugar transferase [Emericellopsis atlantica]